MPGAIWVLAWPTLAESLLNSLVGLTDTVLAANLDDTGAAADAVGGAAYVLWFGGLIAQAVSIASVAYISRAIGAGKRGVANVGVGQTLVLAALGAMVVGVAIAALAPVGADVLGLQGHGRSSFLRYVWINCVGLPFSGLLFGAIACARAAGDSRTPLLAMIAVNLTNLVLSFLLSGVDLRRADASGAARVVLENPLSINMGVDGIAWGTVLAYVLGAGLMLLALRRGRSGVRLRARALRPHAPTMARLVRLGVPNFLEMVGMWAGNFLVIVVVGWLGSGALGAHLVAIRIEAFSYLPGFAFGTAAATLVGQYLGAGDPARARRAALVCTMLSCGFMGAAGLVLIFIPREVVGLVTSQEGHLATAPAALVVAGFCQIPFAVSIVLRSALRGAGDVRVAMWITWIGTYAVRLPLAWLLSGVDAPLPGGVHVINPFPYDWGLMGLWIGLNIDICFRAVAFGLRFRGDAWTRARV